MEQSLYDNGLDLNRDFPNIQNFNTMKHYLFMGMLLLTGLWAQAQRTDLITGLSVRFQGGPIYSTRPISGLPQTYIPKEWFDFSTFQITQKPHYGSSFGVGFEFRHADWPWFAGRADLQFITLKDGYHYEDIDNYIHDIDFRILYNTLGLAIKVNPWAEGKKFFQGFYALGGVQRGVMVNLPGFVTFHHNEDLIGGSEPGQQGELQRYTRIKPDWGTQAGWGWEQAFGKKFGLGVECKYYWGYADIIQGLPLPVEKAWTWDIPNNTRYWQATLGFHWSLFN